MSRSFKMHSNLAPKKKIGQRRRSPKSTRVRLCLASVFLQHQTTIAILPHRFVFEPKGSYNNCERHIARVWTFSRSLAASRNGNIETLQGTRNNMERVEWSPRCRVSVRLANLVNKFLYTLKMRNNLVCRGLGHRSGTTLYLVSWYFVDCQRCEQVLIAENPIASSSLVWGFWVFTCAFEQLHRSNVYLAYLPYLLGCHVFAADLHGLPHLDASISCEISTAAGLQDNEVPA